MDHDIKRQISIITKILQVHKWNYEDIQTALTVIMQLVTKATIVEVLQEATEEQRDSIASTPSSDLTLEKTQEILGIDNKTLQEKFVKALEQYTEQLPGNVNALTKALLEEPNTHN